MEKQASFAELGVAKIFVDKLQAMDIQYPTAVQTQSIPAILAGKDLIGQSPTGTGKTFAYLLPILTKIDIEVKAVQALILAPTKELAMQITTVANNLTEGTGMVTVPLIGDANIQRQMDNLKKKPQLIVGTAGRVAELIRLRKIKTPTIQTVVIDEMDKMWGMGFKGDVQAILKATLRDRQVVMVSATIAPENVVDALAITTDPELVNLSVDNQTAETIKHCYFLTQEKNKAVTLQKLLRIYKPQKAVVFINSNAGVMPFVKRFRELGFAAEGLYSEMTPQERKAAVEMIRSGKTQLLVTTDLFARGMDISNIEIVFNFDIPIDPEHYIHRVGRTGRAGKQGLAINFATPEQQFIIAKYEKRLKIKIEEFGVSEDKIISVQEIMEKRRQKTKSSSDSFGNKK